MNGNNCKRYRKVIAELECNCTSAVCGADICLNKLSTLDVDVDVT